MKKIYLLKTISFALSVFLLGCDVTSNDSSSGGVTDGGTSSSGGGESGDPVVVDYPIAYIQRPVPMGLEDDDAEVETILSNDVLNPTEFRPGAKLIIKDRASVSASARVITADVFAEEGQTTEPLYDVRDLSVNSLGTKLLFSMRAPEIEGADDEDQPTWNIWEYDRETDTLTRLIESDIIAEQGHDRFAIYLPDDTIVFSSTRQRTSRSMLLDQSRPQYSYITERDDAFRAFTLHRMDEDRREIDQISYGKGHDISPTMLDDGRIMFMRGDDTSNTNDDRLSLYTMNPDGSNVSLYYGFHSPSGSEPTGDNIVQGALIKPYELPDGKIMVSYRPRESFQFGGDIYTVDTENYIDLTQPSGDNIGGTGPAEESLSIGEVILEAQSPHGYFNSAYPLFDGTDRLLVSWMPCLVLGYRFNIYVNVDGEGEDAVYQLIDIGGAFVDRDGNVSTDPVSIEQSEITPLPCTTNTFENDNIVSADPQYGIWIYDPVLETQDPVVFSNVRGIMYTDAVAFEPRTPPTFIPNLGQDEFTATLKDENVGILKIRSIFDFDGVDVTPDGIAAMADPLRTETDDRPIRFVRFYEQANSPHEDDYEIDTDLVRGRNGQPGRGIIGYAPVHPDGSVMTKLPANVQFSMEFLDADGHRVTGTFGTRHRYWLNLRPGEVRECNGCHSAGSTLPHGRSDAEAESANPGSLSGAQFPNTSLRDRFGSPYPGPNVGETMAEFYARSKMADVPSENSDDYNPIAPSLDLIFTDEWTDPASGATPGAEISIKYGVLDETTGLGGPDNLQTLAPVLIGDCLVSWNSLCRTVIDYPDHIQPIFEVERLRDVDGIETNVTCTNCHSTIGPDGNQQIPAPNEDDLQLDFSPIESPLNNIFLKGYDELFEDGEPLQGVDENGNIGALFIPLVVDGQTVYQMQNVVDENGIVQFEAIDQFGNTVCVPQDTIDPDVTLVEDADGENIACQETVFETDDMGNPVLDEFGQPIPVPELVAALQDQYLNGQGANAARNQRFFDAFGIGGAHEGYLTPAELKLFAEWLDIGGQYYNEIFKALDD